MNKPTWYSLLLQRSIAASEIGQAKIRVVNVSPVCVYLIAAWHFQWQSMPTSIAIGAAGYIGYTILWLFLVAGDVFSPALRRGIAAVLDQLLPALGMYLGGFTAAYVAWVPALASIGSGLRFGTRYSWLSSLVSAPAMGAAFYFSSDWRSIPAVALGIVLANVFVPLYAVILVKRLERENQTLLARTAYLEHVNRHDALTGLLNRQGFLDALSRLHDRKKQDGDQDGRVAVMVIDLDGFKEINDTLGHDAGDRILATVALGIKEALHEQGSAARLGGDEFAVVLAPVRSLREVEMSASRILAAVKATTLPGRGLKLSASIGLCISPCSALAEADLLMAKADRLMYEAKSRGKDQTCIHE